MKIVTFCEVDESLFNPEFTVEYFHTGTSGEADIVILNIDSIFEFEENKSKICKEKFVSIAVIEDESDYDAFKNFGIDAWIKSSDISQINNIINLVNKRFLS
ncbi:MULTISPECIES: hypothetical protein [Arcobacter]|jgi:hypothetical protein|uniref:Uncharacterized protein n=1 Tax=Arcobacter ellisii TaxID=913109 RepID=A0A347U7F9_9BACT|nr:MULTISPECIES: hypothetical protein [Arcobacter]AXX94787.1 hypothetical protein AELL_1117 [Arcobacter ellisii]MDD3007892.1 hypothetical protein [Arcobacter sp.]MDY3204811.1 hypothetical protein [Arcobacter sp.]RXI30615.1 hypothetical protein CP962_07545 [Arcobacter ellisii]